MPLLTAEYDDIDITNATQLDQSFLVLNAYKCDSDKNYVLICVTKICI